ASARGRDPGTVEIGEHLGQARELEPVQLDVLPRRELAVAAPVAVRNLADRAQLRGRELPRRQLDPQHERADLRLVVVEAPPLEPHDVFFRHVLVTRGDQRRQLVADPERRLLPLQALDGVALENELPVRIRATRGGHRGSVGLRLQKVKPLAGKGVNDFIQESVGPVKEASRSYSYCSASRTFSRAARRAGTIAARIPTRIAAITK